ncbi:hypothetical protein MTP99_005083 [Tenebrio molitor]|jgi:hypothetical protein|nr:hypothetical protein MTP99_005083 [Tenebrio molitor]
MYLAESCRSHVVFLSDIIYFDVATKNPKIVIDDHDYLVYRKETNRTIWKCNHYFNSRENRCKSTIVTSGRIVRINNHQHNHEAKPRKDRKFRNLLSQYVTIQRDP